MRVRLAEAHRCAIGVVADAAPVEVRVAGALAVAVAVGFEVEVEYAGATREVPVDITRWRRRFMLAMGIAAPIAACHQDPAESPGPTASTGTATATPTPSSTASSEPTPPPLPPGMPNFPPCPNGHYCVTQPVHLARDAGAAPLPFAMCAESAEEEGRPEHQFRAISFDADATKAARDKGQAVCCYGWVTPCPGGRPLRADDGEAVIAASLAREDWVLANLWQATDSLRDAASWAEEAATEHASIASFARVALDLLALGAPPWLIAAAHRAAADEIRHARIAYSLARATADRELGPAGLPRLAAGGPVTLASFARATLRDGCIGEAAAAIALREQAAATSNRRERALLLSMAEDEERHAELAYAMLAWAHRRGGAEVTLAIAEELARPRQGHESLVTCAIARPCVEALLSAVPPKGCHEGERANVAMS